MWVIIVEFYFVVLFQLASLTHCPFSVIAKAGTVIEKSHLMDTLPVVWELLLDDDQQLVSSAGKVLNTDQNDAVLFHFSFKSRKKFRICYYLLRSVISR